MAKTKTLVCCTATATGQLYSYYTVTAQLIYVFVFSYADCWFSHAKAQIISINFDIFNGTGMFYFMLLVAFLQHGEKV